MTFSNPASALNLNLDVAHRCLRENHLFPAMTLIFPVIDICAWFSVKSSVHGRDEFILWADRYVVPNLEWSRTNGRDLWGARCGVLHMGTAESRPTKKETDRARKIFYMWGTEYREPNYEQSDGTIVYLHLDELIQATHSGVTRFFMELENLDPMPKYLKGKLGKFLSIIVTRNHSGFIWEK